MADPVGALYVELAASTARFISDLEKAQGKLKQTGKAGDDFGAQFARAGKIAAAGVAAIAAAAATAATGIFALTKSTANTGDALDNMSKRTDTSVETLSELSYVAKMADTDAQALQKSYIKLSANAFAASQGASEQANAFRLLHVSVTDTNGQLKPGMALMMEVGDRLSQLTNTTERAAIGTMLFGRQYQELAPLLLQGSAATRKQIEEAHLLGAVWSTEAATAAAELNDNMDRMGVVVDGITKTIGNALIPVVNDVMVGVVDWFKANEKVIKQELKEWAESAAAKVKDLASHAKDVAAALVTMRDMWRDLKAVGVVGFISGLVESLWALLKVVVDISVMMAQQFAINFMRPFAMLPGFIGRKAQEIIDQWEASNQDWRDSMTRNTREMLQAVGLIQRDEQTQQVRQYDAHVTEFLGRVQKKNKAHLDMDLAGHKERSLRFAEALMEQERLASMSGGNVPAMKLSGEHFQRLDLAQALQRSYIAQGKAALTLNEALVLLNAKEEEGAAIQAGLNESYKSRFEVLENSVTMADALAQHQAAVYQQEGGLIGDVDAVRQAAFQAQDARRSLEVAKLDEQLQMQLISQETYHAKLLALEGKSEVDRMNTVSQFPSFWEQQLGAVVASNAFSIGSIVSTWSNGLAQVIVKGGDFKAAWEATQMAVVQGFINTGIQAVATEILTQMKLTAAQAAGATSRVAITQAEATAEVGIMAGAQAAILGMFAAVSGAMKALFVETLWPMIVAVGTKIMAVLTAIAKALGLTAIFGNVGGAIAAGVLLAGVAAIAASLAGGVELAMGGIATGPTKALIGEGGSPEAIIPLNKRGTKFMANVFADVVPPTPFMAGRGSSLAHAPMLGHESVPQRSMEIHIHSNLNGRELAHEILDYTIDGLRLRGATI